MSIQSKARRKPLNTGKDKRWRQIRKWGKATAKSLGIKREKDVERIIDESSKNSRE